MQSNVFIGVDVAKDHVVVAWHDARAPTRSITNARRELGTWLDSLPPKCCLGVESTGRYHELLVGLACARGMRVYLLNPRALHHYAKALHRGNKTDRLDAELIARYVAAEHLRLRPYTPPTASEYQLLTLQRRRAKLVSIRHSLRQSMRDVPDLSEHVQVTLRSFENLINAIDQVVAQLIEREPERRDLAQRLRSLPGFGPLNSHHYATLLPRIDAPNADACVAYTGLDLRARDSGRFRGQRKLTKHGPSETRRLIYLAAQAAARSNPHWNALYRQLLDKGRTPTQAIVILARKLLRIAYHLYRHGGSYDPVRFAQNAGLAT